jgi:Protein of unknown function (DUF4238)
VGVLNFAYLPPPTPAEYQQLVNKLAREAPVLRPDQHVVSRVLLDHFAEEVGAKGERKVRILKRERLEAKPTELGPAGCGKFRHFVRFASQSSEEIWARTETRLRAAVNAAHAGTFYDVPEYSDAVRDAIVLHYVRSIPALILHDETWRNRHAAHVQWWMTQRRPVLERMHQVRFGWSATSDDALRMMAEDLIGSVAGQMDRGIYFRVMVVERFDRYCQMLQNQPVELRRVWDGELLISDVPVMAMRSDHPGTGPRDASGLADCDELVLPLGPRLLGVLGAGSTFTDIGGADVDRLNAAQVRAAADHLYMRRSSGLEGFVRAQDITERPNKIPDYLRQGKHPTRLDPLAGRRAAGRRHR